MLDRQRPGPRISLIAAMAEDRVIGVENRLPWRLPSDMKWFRRHTLGKPIIMGRKTFESFGAKPLPDRLNIVMTRDPAYRAEGVVVVHSIEEAITAAGQVDEVMVIGGASFYEQMLPYADRLYLTFVHTKITGDAWFPDYDTSEWHELERQDVAADERNPYAHSFCIFERQ